MSAAIRDDLRNVAIVAHVDHGKTTLVDVGRSRRCAGRLGWLQTCENARS